jgi:hypothetical protein
VDANSTHGIAFTVTLEEPGAHGAEMTGTQGWGASTPEAAAVAAATCGLVGLTHNPNDPMLAVGLKSVTTANVVVAEAGPGSAVNTAGNVPIVQAIADPLVTACVTSPPHLDPHSRAASRTPTIAENHQYRDWSTGSTRRGSPP